MRKTRIFYFFILLLGVAAAIALGTSTAFLTLYIIALLPLIALISLVIYPAAVRAWPQCERRYVFKGEEPVLSLRIRNRSLLPYPDVEISLLDHHVEYIPEDNEDGPRLSLPARHYIDRHYALRFPFRGVYNVGLREARATDFLGLFRMRFEGRQRQSITVYPKLIEGFHMPLSTRQNSEGDVGFDRFADQMADVTDVRKHDPSDDYRKIHWKLTAKRGEFIVKNFRTPGLTRTVVLLDTAHCGARDRLKLAYDDLLASLAASGLDYCLKNRQAAQLVYGREAGDRLDILNPEDMELAYGLLAVLPFEGERAVLAQSLQGLLLSRQSFADLAVVAGTVDEAVCDLLKAAFTAGHEVFLYYVYPATTAPTKDDYDLLDGLAAYGIAVEIVK